MWMKYCVSDEDEAAVTQEWPLPKIKKKDYNLSIGRLLAVPVNSLFHP